MNGERGVGGSRQGRRREGFTGFQSGRRDQNYRQSSAYRADVARRTGATRSNWNGYNGGHHYHNHHYYGGFGRRYFGFGFGFGGFGFGGFGFGGFNSFYARVFWGYPFAYWPFFGNAFYYPCWGFGYYPYFASYNFFPVQRTVFVNGGGLGVAGLTGGSWVGRGYDDPYVEPEAPPGEEAPLDVEGASDVAPIEPIDAAAAGDGTQVLSSPLTEGVDSFEDVDAARSAGDRYLRDGWGMKAAEAYRQAWRKDPTDDTTLRLAAALLEGGDYPLAGWALVRGIGTTEKRVLDFTVLLDDLLDGPRITRSVQSLEKYLVNNPNDEGSNLLLGALYVVTGREYAGYVVLSRLRAAEYETATVDLFIAQARMVIGEGR